MKRKRTNRLSCERARAFPIEKALAKLGHFPTRSTEKEAWFLSPFRSETQASFKVSKKLNRWYDHGAGKGGNVIDLICLLNNGTVKEALKLIQQEQISFSFQQQPIIKEEQDTTIRVAKVMELTHFALRDYLKSRNISIPTAHKLIKEVHYRFKDKTYFALGLKNGSGGWELRNKYVKNSSSPKDVTHINNGRTKLIITEGMFDLLSIMECNVKLELEYDFLVLNSTAFVQKARGIMKGYSCIDLYLDNDATGEQATKNFLDHANNSVDRSLLFAGFKDMNEWLMSGAKEANGQGIQDVFLLPQKQSCFAPDGRKENKK
ncbi:MULTISPECIES: toprim domain-containing protein [unclassified Arenibacter]|uniref:toprim domain-containing protein n=1 Tax=unclassified Arenibacter TaxID=2615047 RepID=UPI000E34BA62|nr:MULTISPECIES: toprim domain-containing protein [unclassified Arenibacter]MCM4162448.1 DNA primase [Arenibacter sp. A80]RFT58041.1 DNA primase [Arenibacter sp. P308M17]